MAQDLSSLSQKERNSVAEYIRSCELVKKNNGTILDAYQKCDMARNEAEVSGGNLFAVGFTGLIVGFIIRSLVR